MKAIVIAVCLSCMSLIFGGCSTVQSPPQIVKVKQKSEIPTTLFPEVLNANEWCKRTETECILGIVTYNHVVISEAFAVQNVSVRAYK